MVNSYTMNAAVLGAAFYNALGRTKMGEASEFHTAFANTAMGQYSAAKGLADANKAGTGQANLDASIASLNGVVGLLQMAGISKLTGVANAGAAVSLANNIQKIVHDYNKSYSHFWCMTNK